MLFNSKQILLISILLSAFNLLAFPAHAENVDELIKAQKELNIASDEKAKELQAQQKTLKETKDAIAMGKKEYVRTCSLCHGMDGKGRGVYAFELKTAPSNLTLIEKKNYGVFPYEKLYQIIDGRKEVKSHGVRDMPIWGDRYNSEIWLETSPQNYETFIRGRIFELLLYLETIQQ